MREIAEVVVVAAAAAAAVGAGLDAAEAGIAAGFGG